MLTYLLPLKSETLANRLSPRGYKPSSFFLTKPFAVLPLADVAFFLPAGCSSTFMKKNKIISFKPVD